MRATTRPCSCGVLALALLAGCPADRHEAPGAEKGTGRATGEVLHLIPTPEASLGWQVSGKPVTYSPENLFEYLDGGAPRYLSYGFAALVQVRYAREGEPHAGVTLDVYDMGRPLGAFGIYSSARPTDVPPREWCVEGYRSGTVAAAWQDRIYVHVAADEERPELLDLAERLVASVCARAPGEPSPPSVLAALPPEGLVPRSERYVAVDLLGHAFLPGGVLAAYEIGGRKAEVFFSDLGTAPAAREAIARLRAHHALRGAPVRDGPAIGDAGLRHEDPTLGPGTVVGAGRFVAGVHGDLPYEEQDRLLSRLVGRLRPSPEPGR